MFGEGSKASEPFSFYPLFIESQSFLFYILLILILRYVNTYQTHFKLYCLMEKTKVISVRLRQSTIDDLDQLAAKSSYWKRNAIIEQLIRKMIDFADEATLWRIIKAYHSATETQKIEFVTQPPRD